MYIHRAGSAENGDSNEEGHQIGNDAYGGGEAFLGPFDEGIVHIDLSSIAPTG